MVKHSLFLLTPLLILAHPFAAFAEESGIKLDIGGHFKIYSNYADINGDSRHVDILRDTDVTLAGETSLSDGLTVGALINADGDGGDGFAVEDSFLYFSGNWGRFSMGIEDGAAFILQVAAPSADDNVDGIETFVNPFNFAATSLSGTNFETEVSAFGLDYDNDLTAGIDKFTYLTPVFEGFQAGVSYTPDVANFSPASRGPNGNSPDNALDEFGDAWEIAARYEGIFKPQDLTVIDYIIGAGYTNVNTERTNAASTIDTFKEWNVGVDLGYGPFGLGIVYTENNGGAITGNDSQTFVTGIDYTTGPYKFGTSWLRNNHEEGSVDKIKADRFAAGVIYEYGPGLSFRGSVSHVMTDVPDIIGGDVDGTAVTIGTQILF